MQGQRRVCEGTARAHLGGDPDGLHDLFVAGPCAVREPGVTFYAVGALGHVRHGDRDELFGLLRQGAVGEDPLAELVEGSVDVGRELASAVCDVAAGGRIHGFSHG